MTVKPLLSSRRFSTKEEPLLPPEDETHVSTPKKVLLFFILFVLPFIGITVMTLSNIFLLERSVIRTGIEESDAQLHKESSWNMFPSDLVDAWEKRYGSFIRNYYLEPKVVERIKSAQPEEENEDNLQWGLPYPPVPEKSRCENIGDDLKFDCFPRGGPITEKSCNERGCCYTNITLNRDPRVPICYYPNNYMSYKYTNITYTSHPPGISAKMTAQFRSPYPNDIINLGLNLVFLTDDIFLIIINDTDKPRFQTSFPEEPLPGIVNDPSYEIKMDLNSTGFQVLRKSTGKIIFDAKDLGGFIYSDQFIQISIKLPSKFIYGLGEQRNNFLRNLNWTTIPLFNHDSVPKDNVNGYGFQPTYLCMEEGGTSHAVSALNSYPMDIVLQPGPAVTFRIIGGNLVFLIAMGPSPVEVVKQLSITGRPALPPYWALGFHLSRFGYKSVDDMARIWNQTVEAQIPFDTQWTDLDYMENRNDFTLNDNFKDLSKFVHQLHNRGMHHVIIIDPGISGSEPPGTYPPYDIGMNMSIFVMDSTGKKPFIGKVWNAKSTVFPDFYNPKAIEYWMIQLQNFHKLVPFDGVWLDMNEPSNFLNGTVSGCPNNNWENPPYLPSIDGGLLSYKTICMSASHFQGFKHYALHNVYGTFETIITSFVMGMIRKSRPLVISRSSFLNHGSFGGHWTGDVMSTWDDMKHSISDILSFSLFGIPLVGADICGFNGNTTVALCQRWSQLGAFYPFSRNHNSDDTIAQDPVSLGDDVVKSARRSLQIRYMLLPYLYTLFWEAHLNGTPVVQPLFFQFPKDPNTYSIVTQFMWGRSLLIAPVLEEGMTYVEVYLGEGLWCNANTKLCTESKGKYFAAPAPPDTIPLFVRGGSIIPEQMFGNTTTESRKKPLLLNVALDNNSQAEGKLYWDDGESLEFRYDLIEWKASAGKLESKVVVWDYDTDLTIQIMHIYPLPTVHNVTLDSVPIPFKYAADIKNLLLADLNIKLNHEFKLVWS